MQTKLDLSYAVREADLALSGAAADVGLHLAPALITRHAARRMERTLRALEDFVRRILLVLALQFEQEISVDMSERPYPKRAHTRQRSPDAPASFRILPNTSEAPLGLYDRLGEPKPIERGPVKTGALLARIQRLKNIIANPDARAHRYAFTLARHHHYAIFAPGRPRIPAKLGTGITTLYKALYSRVLVQSRDNRPDPKGPRPRPPPRILFP